MKFTIVINFLRRVAYTTFGTVGQRLRSEFGRTAKLSGIATALVLCSDLMGCGDSTNPETEVVVEVCYYDYPGRSLLPWATVNVDGNSVGESSDGDSHVWLAPGFHSFTVHWEPDPYYGYLFGPILDVTYEIDSGSSGQGQLPFDSGNTPPITVQVPKTHPGDYPFGFSVVFIFRFEYVFPGY